MPAGASDGATCSTRCPPAIVTTTTFVIIITSNAVAGSTSAAEGVGGGGRQFTIAARPDDHNEYPTGHADDVGTSATWTMDCCAYVGFVACLAAYAAFAAR